MKTHKFLEKYGKPYVYNSYKPESINPLGSLVTLALTVNKKDFSVILSLQEELNLQGFNNFRSFDNNQPGWPLYTSHIICNAYTLEAKIGYYDQFVKPEDSREVDITICEQEELDKIIDNNKKLSHPLSYSGVPGDDYLQITDELSKKASNFLDKHQIFDSLSKYGKLEVYGSYKLGLMNRPDIDTILVVDKKDFSIAVEIQRQLQQRGFTNFWVFDNSKGGSVDDPKHIIVDSYADEWEMGITICNRDEADSVLIMTRQIETAIKNDPSLKKQILKLKHQVALQHGVRHFPSRIIYQAVLEEDAQNVEDFEKYIKEKQFS